jgi:hypothetical protein
MQMLAQEYPITQIGEVLDVARSTYYHRRVPIDEQEVRQAIEMVAAEYPRYGYRRITHQLRRQGQIVNHKRVERIMRECGLLFHEEIMPGQYMPCEGLPWRTGETYEQEHRDNRHRPSEALDIAMYTLLLQIVSSLLWGEPWTEPFAKRIAAARGARANQSIHKGNRFVTMIWAAVLLICALIAFFAGNVGNKLLLRLLPILLLIVLVSGTSRLLRWYMTKSSMREAASAQGDETSAEGRLRSWRNCAGSLRYAQNVN